MMDYNNSLGFSKQVALDAVLFLLEENGGTVKINDLMNALYLFERDNILKYAWLALNDMIVCNVNGFSFVETLKLIESGEWKGFIDYTPSTGLMTLRNSTKLGHLSEENRDSLSACIKEVISINKARDFRHFVSLPEHEKMWGFDSLPISIRKLYEEYSDLSDEYIQEALDEIDYSRKWNDITNRWNDGG